MATSIATASDIGHYLKMLTHVCRTSYCCPPTNQPSPTLFCGCARALSVVHRPEPRSQRVHAGYPRKEAVHRATHLPRRPHGARGDRPAGSGTPLHRYVPTAVVRPLLFRALLSVVASLAGCTAWVPHQAPPCHYGTVGTSGNLIYSGWRRSLVMVLVAGS